MAGLSFARKKAIKMAGLEESTLRLYRA